MNIDIKELNEQREQALRNIEDYIEALEIATTEQRNERKIETAQTNLDNEKEFLRQIDEQIGLFNEVVNEVSTTTKDELNTKRF